jgi:hypothetical protein
VKNLIFKPVWDSFNLPDVAETIGVNIPSKLALRATVMLDPGETVVRISEDDSAAVIKVSKDGEEQLAYSLENGLLTVAPTFDDVSVLEVERSGAVTYSVFVGQIVPGITISATGRLRGIVGNIPFKEPHFYRFGLRATWEGMVADVIKEWLATPVDNQLTWNIDTLPAPQTDSSKVTGRTFHTIGEFRRGQKVEVGIDLFNPDFTNVEVEMRSFSGMVANSRHYGGALPTGLSISNNPFVISGFIPAEALAGDYFFEVFVNEPYGPTPIILHIKLLGDQFDDFTAINRITWTTEPNLGSIKEGLPCLFRVSATNSTGQAVTYRLAPGSRPLPTGLALTTTGEIRGRAPHVASDVVANFSVKATSGPFVSTQAFSMKVLKTFEEPNHLTVSLPLSGPTRRSWQAYATQIPSNRRFRSNDPSFGSAKPDILLVRGLRNRPLENLEYDKAFELIVGPFKSAKVIDNGIHVYDVIYRDFFDPMHGAGGFIPGDANVVESPVFYPQNPAIRINEGTVRNIRSDLVTKVGLASKAPKRRVLGLLGGELLDRWMTTPQEDGKTIGFVTAGIIDYVQAGRGATLVKTLTYGDIPVGTSISFDRLLVQGPQVTYHYHLGWGNNNDGNIELSPPLAPVDYRVDGVPIDLDNGMHPLPTLSWSPSETAAVTYTLRFYNAGTLIRTETGLTSTSFTYSSAMQAEDDNPAHLFVDLTAEQDERVSTALRASVRLRAGWGYAWGFRYGGAG